MIPPVIPPLIPPIIPSVIPPVVPPIIPAIIPPVIPAVIPALTPPSCCLGSIPQGDADRKEEGTKSTKGALNTWRRQQWAPGLFWRPHRAGRDRPGVPAHIWLPKAESSPAANKPHSREGKGKNLGVVQFLAPDLLGNPPVDLPWAWQACQHPEKHSQAWLREPRLLPVLPGTQPQVWGWIRNQGEHRDNQETQTPFIFFHSVSFPTCWQLLSLGEGLCCSSRAPGLLPQAPGLWKTLIYLG